MGLGDSWRQTLDWCEQHPYPTRAEMENSEIGEALTGRDLDGLTDPDEWDRFVAGVRREVELNAGLDLNLVRRALADGNS